MSLRTKITVLTTVIAISVVFFTLLPIRHVTIEAFRDELEKRAISITRNLSDRVATHVVLHDQFQARKALMEVLAKEKDVEYIFLTNEEGAIFTHTFDTGVPDGLLTWNPLEDEATRIQLLDTEKGYIRDVAVPVLAGTGSELHVGIREDSLVQTLSRMRKLTIPIILVVTALGLVASFIFSRLITNPLKKFVDFTRALGRGEFGKRVDVKYGDEIGYLARNFNTLSSELQHVKEKMEEAYTYTHLLQAEKLSSIGQISAGLAHELKNPLTTLRMLFQAFKEQPDMTREDAEIIYDEIEKINTILNRFLGFVKEKSLHISDVSMKALIDRVLALATFEMRQNNIAVHTDLEDGLPSIRGDRALLEHVFLNLVLNSVEAMTGGGEIRIWSNRDDRFLELKMSDRGGGIPEDIRTKVFDPFFTTKTNGTGLGLSIAYNIVKSHGGQLYFYSNEGKGTMFTVRLPVSEHHE